MRHSGKVKYRRQYLWSIVFTDPDFGVLHDISIHQYTIPIVRFNNKSWINNRLKSVNPQDYHAVQKTLRYLYEDNASMNLPRNHFKIAEKYLDTAEKIVARWLITRTNGSERKNYGPFAGIEAKESRYRCRNCSSSDVRVLYLDHVAGRKSDKKEFRCLCANCHMIKSRESDWQRAE